MQERTNIATSRVPVAEQGWGPMSPRITAHGNVKPGRHHRFVRARSLSVMLRTLRGDLGASSRCRSGTQVLRTEHRRLVALVEPRSCLGSREIRCVSLCLLLA